MPKVSDVEKLPTEWPVNVRFGGRKVKGPTAERSRAFRSDHQQSARHHMVHAPSLKANPD